MTKADIVSEISATTGVSKGVAMEVVEKFMDVVKEALANGENVYLRGFGSFEVKARAQKIARDIKNNAPLVVPAHNIPCFKPSPMLKISVAQ